MCRAISFYRFHHVERGMGMIFKAVGLPPRGRAKFAWYLLQRGGRRFEQRLEAMDLPLAA